MIDSNFTFFNMIFMELKGAVIDSNTRIVKFSVYHSAWSASYLFCVHPVFKQQTNPVFVCNSGPVNMEQSGSEQATQPHFSHTTPFQPNQ